MKKTVLITGGSRGIGKASAELFARQGYNVVINYFQSAAAAQALAAELTGEGLSIMVCPADVSKREQVDAMVQTVLECTGSIEVLINNAGIAQQKLFTDITAEDWDAMLDVNVKGIFNCCQAVVPGMISRKRGKIINLASIWGITGASCEVHYSTAKAAVIGFTKALARELGPSNIQVNCVAPGIISTDMNAALEEEDRQALIDATPLMRLGTPQDVAYALLFLASEQADFLTGQILSPNGGFVI